MENEFSKLIYLIQGARWQDSLLQSYRAIYLTSQSILFAILTGLAVFHEKLPNVSFSLNEVLLYIFGVLGILLAIMFYEILKYREKDVDYWQKEIKKIEGKIEQEDDRYFSNFKDIQDDRRGLFGVRRLHSLLFFFVVPVIWFTLLILGAFCDIVI